MDQVPNHKAKVRVNAHAGKDFQEPILIDTVISLSLVKANDETIGISSFSKMGNLRGQPGMVGDEAARYKTLLIIMELEDSPRGQTVIDEVSIHLAVCVHG